MTGRPDPDPLHVDEMLWDPRAKAFVPRPSALWALLTGIVAGAVGGIVLGFLLSR